MYPSNARAELALEGARSWSRRGLPLNHSHCLMTRAANARRLGQATQIQCTERLLALDELATCHLLLESGGAGLQEAELSRRALS